MNTTKPYETLIVSGCEYHLKFTTANAVKLEDTLNMDLLTGSEKLAEIRILANYFFAATVSLNDNINKLEDVYQVFDDYITEGGTYNNLQQLVIEALITSGIMSREIYDASKKAAEKQLEALKKSLI